MEANKLEQTAPLIVITGPTASGKTSLAIKLAKKQKKYCFLKNICYNVLDKCCKILYCNIF